MASGPTLKDDGVFPAERRPAEQGRRVLLLRSAEQSADLGRALAQDGIAVVSLPCLEIGPPPDPGEVARHFAAAPLAFDGVIVSSVHGVDALRQAFDQLARPISLGKALVAAIGHTTAAKLATVGLHADLIAEPSNSEGLLAALRAHKLLGQRWLHVRGARGRDLLGPAIEAAGGRYVLAIAYTTQTATVTAEQLKQLEPRDDGVPGLDAVCITSGAVAEAMVEILSNAWGPDIARQRLVAARMIAIGPVTARAIEALGFVVDEIASTPDDIGMLAAVRRAFACTTSSP